MDRPHVDRSQEEQLSALVEAVLERHLHPEDEVEVAAILESMGWNDARVKEQFEAANVFDLAHEIWNRSRREITFDQHVVEVRTPAVNRVGESARQFLRGVIFALPMAISIFAMFTLKFSLWSYEKLSVSLATAIAIGTILSFITVGGFTQAIARRGYYYIFQGYYNMSRRVTFYFIGMGFLISVVLSLGMFALNWLTQIFTGEMMWVVLLFYFVLNSIWLSVTVMYILKREILFTALVVLGVGLVYVFFVLLHWGILISQLLAMSVISMVSLGLVAYLFRKAEQRAERGIYPRLPKMSVTMYSTLPYFIYGLVYFLFLFIDRLVSWSTNNVYMPYLIWFRGDYEVGLDFALLTLIIPMGVSEVIISRLMLSISTSQHGFAATQTQTMNLTYVRDYWKHLIVMGITGTLNAVGIYYGVKVYLDKYLLLLKEPILIQGTTNFVFTWALAAYVLIAVALLNVVFLFTLSQPNRVLRTLLIALVVNLTVGFLLTRWIDYTYAVFGLFAGAIVLVLMSTFDVILTLRNLDYHLYELS